MRTSKEEKEQVKILLNFFKEKKYPEIRYFFKRELTPFLLNLFIKTFFPLYFTYEDAPFHKDIDEALIEGIGGFHKHINIIGFYESAKTTRVKMIVAMIIALEIRHFIRVVSADIDNAETFVSDVFNLLNNELCRLVFPNLLTYNREKKAPKRMNYFKTNQEVTIQSLSPLGNQSGKVQSKYRPDLVIFDDIESYSTLFSTPITEKIFYGIKGARNGMNKAIGFSVLLGNYLSDTGNIHNYLELPEAKNIIIPLVNKKGEPTWKDKYVKTDKEAVLKNKKRIDENKVVSVEAIKRDIYASWEEYQCIPVSAEELFFSSERIEYLLKNSKKPLTIDSNFKIFEPVEDGVKYSLGADISEGVGRDLSTTSIFAFYDDRKACEVACFESNRIDPFTFADEIIREAKIYNKAFLTPENNAIGYATVGELAKKYDEDLIFKHYLEDVAGAENNLTSRLGWRATQVNISKAFYEFKKDFDMGDIVIYNKDTLLEMKHFKLSDLQSVGAVKKVNRRVVGGSHFDRLRALVLAWVGRKQAVKEKYMGVLFA